MSPFPVSLGIKGYDCEEKKLKFSCAVCGNQIAEPVYHYEKPLMTIMGTESIKNKKGLYLCDSCLSNGADQSYSNSMEWIRHGTARDRLPSWGVELEGDYKEDLSSFPNWVARHMGWKPREDGTVDMEVASPIYLSHRTGLADVVRMVAQTQKVHGLSPVSTHVHVEGGLSLMRWGNRLADQGRSNYSKGTFKNPVAEIGFGSKIVSHLENGGDHFWGRKANEWCQTRDKIDTDNHYAWLSLNFGNGTLEWRRPCFVTADQFSAVVKFCRRATVILSQMCDQFEMAVPSYALTPAMVRERKRIVKQTMLRIENLYFKQTGSLGRTGREVARV